MSHSGFGVSIFAMSSGESKARGYLLPRLDDSETWAEVCGCCFCGPTVAPDKFSLSNVSFSLTVGNFSV